MYDGLTYDIDDRHDEPNQDNLRREQFRRGWEQGTKWREAPEEQRETLGYTLNTLKKLHWNNLGFRLGVLFGRTNLDQINSMYDWCVDQQDEQTQNAVGM